MAKRWSNLHGHLVQLDKHWQVWIDWYNDVLVPPMPSRGEAWEAAFTNVQDPSYPWKGLLPWDDGPEAVNLAIKARLDALQGSAALDAGMAGASAAGLAAVLHGRRLGLPP